MAHLPDTPCAEFHADLLLDQGYCIIPQAISPCEVTALACDLADDFSATPLSAGPFYGDDTKRFGSLLRRSDRTRDFVQHPMILDIVQKVLGPWCDHFSLNLTQAIELMPGSRKQVPHRDQDMWPCSRLVDPALGVKFLVNVMWPFTPYTQENGTTHVWPGSHRRCSEVLIDPHESIVAEMEPGAALLFLGSTLHAGGANRSLAPRRGMIISYTLGWLKPYELQWLAYPPEVARTFDADLTDLLGYRIHRPNLGNHEGRCPSLLLRDPGRQVGAIDMLASEQHALIDAFRAGELPKPVTG